MDEINPFDPLGIPDKPANGIGGLKVAVNNEVLDPLASGFDEKNNSNGQMPASPTAATDIPDWYGHTLNSIRTHQTADDPMAFFDEVSAPKPTQTNQSSSSSENMLSPQIKQKGSIAPPRSKGQKSPKTKKQSKNSHSVAKSFETNPFSFGVQYDNGATTPVPDDNSNTDFPFGTDKNKKENKDDEKQVEETPKQTTKGNEPKESKPEKQKTESKDSKDSKEKKKTPKVDAIEIMKKGSSMLKYGRHGFPHFRRFQIVEDLTKLVWFSRRKQLKDTHILISDMKDVLVGQQTEVFKQCTQPSLSKASFSIVYSSKLKTLDLVGKSSEEAQLWIKGLKGLIKANEQGRLHQVLQILVRVPYLDISAQLKYKNYSAEDKEIFAEQFVKQPELKELVTKTLDAAKKSYERSKKLSDTQVIKKHSEYENLNILQAEIENRLTQIQYGIDNTSGDLYDLKRDAWILKVDVAVYEEKVKVLSKSKNFKF